MRKIRISQEAVSQMLKSLTFLDEQLSPFASADRECFQIVLEVRWLKSLLDATEIRLPDWELTLIAVQKTPFVSRYPEVKDDLACIASVLLEI